MAIIAVIIGLLMLPYILFVWVYGVILIKHLIEKELRKPHDILKVYESLTPDQRMATQVKSMVETAWLDSPSPEEAEVKRHQVEKQERLRQGTWENASPEVPPLSRLP